MKKIILILIAILILSCEQVNDIINYFAEITANITEGTTETEFIFEIDTNDELIGIYANDILLNDSRGFNYNFEPGEYIISVETVNGASDELEITVNEIQEVIEEPEILIDPVVETPVVIETPVIVPVEEDPIPEPIEYTTRFIINSHIINDDTVGTFVLLDYPILTHDGIQYNLETMTPDVNGLAVKTSYVDTERLVYVDMNIEFGTDSFLFHSGNMLVIFDFTLGELDTENMSALIEYINYVEPEPEIPEIIISEYRFNLTGTETDIGQDLTFYDDSYIIDGVIIQYEDIDGVIVDSVKTINISITLADKDGFLFTNDNMLKFFGFDFVDMSLGEIRDTVDILDRYPEEYLLDIVFEYYPDNTVLDEMGYFD